MKSEWMGDTPLLPHLIPREDWHRKIMDEFEAGKMNSDELTKCFSIPGIGFHRSMYYMTLGLLYYRECGHKTLAVTPILQEMLLQTSLDGVYLQDVPVLHPCLYVALPNCRLRMWGGNRTQWHDLAGAIVQFVPGKGLGVFLWGTANQHSLDADDDATFWVQIPTRKKIDIPTQLKDLFTKRNEHVVKGDLTEFGRKLELEFDGLTDTPPGIQQENLLNVQQAVRLVINALLYVKTKDHDGVDDPVSLDWATRRQQLQASLARIKNPTKKSARQLQRQLDNTPKTQIMWIGREATSPVSQRCVQGHWWPKRDQLAKMARDNMVAAQWAHDEARIRLAALDKSNSAEIVKETKALLESKKKLAEAKAEADLVENGQPLAHQWVRPYNKNEED